MADNVTFPDSTGYSIEHNSYGFLIIPNTSGTFQVDITTFSIAENCTAPQLYFYERTGVGTGYKLKTAGIKNNSGSIIIDVIAGNSYFILCGNDNNNFRRAYTTTTAYPYNLTYCSITKSLSTTSTEYTSSVECFKSFSMIPYEDKKGTSGQKWLKTKYPEDVGINYMVAEETPIYIKGSGLGIY